MWRTLILLGMGICLTPSATHAALPVGKIPPTVKLDGDLGGKVLGGAWDSQSMKGKVTVLFYVDPDEADVNDQASDALRAENFPLEKYKAIAIINMAATWLPNVAIKGKLKKKQKKYPRALYVMDMEKTLVKKWKQADDSSNVTVFDPQGKVIFAKDGKLSTADIKQVIQLVKDNLPQ